VIYHNLFSFSEWKQKFYVGKFITSFTVTMLAYHIHVVFKILNAKQSNTQMMPHIPITLHFSFINIVSALEIGIFQSVGKWWTLYFRGQEWPSSKQVLQGIQVYSQFNVTSRVRTCVKPKLHRGEGHHLSFMVRSTLFLILKNGFCFHSSTRISLHSN